MPTHDPADPPVVIEIRRRVRPDARAAFEAELKALIQESLDAGNESTTVFRPDEHAREPEYRVVIRFSRLSGWRAWQASERMQRRYAAIREHLVADPVISEVTGLEAWFTLPGEATGPPPPRHKMALVTWFGVFTCVTAVSQALAPVTATWNVHLRTLVVTGLVVLLLTYLVMPRLTRLLRPWLHPSP